MAPFLFSVVVFDSDYIYFIECFSWWISERAYLIQERHTAFYISTTWVDNDHYSIRFCPVYFERPILDESI